MKIWQRSTWMSLCVIAITVCLVTCGDETTVGPTNRNPRQPTINLSVSDSIPNGELAVSVTPTLSWTCTDPDQNDTLTFDVRFGKTDPPPVVSQGQEETSYRPDSLDYNTIYYWQVIAHDKSGATRSSELWSFTTIDITGSYLGSYQHRESNGTVNIMHIVWEFTFDGTWHMDRDTTLPEVDCFCRAFGTFLLTDRITFTLNDGSNQPVKGCDGCDKSDGPSGLFTIVWLSDTLKLVQSNLQTGEVKTVKLISAEF